MKTARKVLMLILCAALLVSATVMGTLAYLKSSTEVVNNTFTYGKVNITLDEADVNAYGEKTDAPRDMANQYKLIPGHNYTKDPTIHVKAGSEKCYLFVQVNNGIANIEAETVKDEEGKVVTDTIANQMKALGWTPIADGSNIYYYEKPVDASEATTDIDVVVFENFTIKNEAEVEKYTTAAITIDAYAIQADGFKTALDAWNADPEWT